jgi:4-amino-4-deoxy-L-arabinose transferase-like glycosyltransferase
MTNKKMHSLYINSQKSCLLALIIVGALLRFWDITGNSYWIDELYSAARAMPEKNIIDVYYWGPEPHPPAHYILLWASYNIFGYHEILGKLISAIAGTLCIPAIYYLGKTMFSKEVGLYSACLLTFTPALIYYSQEARSYELMVLFSILSSYFFFLLQEKKKIILAIIYIGVTIFLINLHFFGIWIFAAQVLFVVIYLTKSFKKEELLFYFLTFGIIASSYIPLLSQMAQAASKGDTWIQSVEITTYILEAFSAYFGNENMFRSYQVVEITLLGISFFLLFTLSFVKLAINKKLSPTFIYISLVFFFVFVASLLMGAYLAPMFNNRNSLPALPFIILVIAWGIHSIKIKKDYGLFFLIAVLIISNINFYNNFEREDWRGAMQKASTIKSPYSNKKHIFVSAWEGEWQVYKKWLGLDDMPIIGVKDLQIDSYEEGDVVWVLWATIKPEDMDNNKLIMTNLIQMETQETNRAGLIQYKISK